MNPDHVLITPVTCDCRKRAEREGYERLCQVCDGGLSVCSRCGTYEAGLDGPCEIPVPQPVGPSSTSSPCVSGDIAANDAAKSGLSRALAALGATILETKVAKGWTVTTPDSWFDPHEIPADLALIHSEVSEALEAFRKNDGPGFAEEMGDVLIRLVGLCHGLGIDLGKEAVSKAIKNRDRAFKHGEKRL